MSKSVLSAAVTGMPVPRFISKGFSGSLPHTLTDTRSREREAMPRVSVTLKQPYDGLESFEANLGRESHPHTWRDIQPHISRELTGHTSGAEQLSHISFTISKWRRFSAGELTEIPVRCYDRLGHQYFGKARFVHRCSQ